MYNNFRLVILRYAKNSTHLHLNIIRWVVSLVTTSFLIISKFTNLFHFTELFESRMNFQNFLESFSKGVVSPGSKILMYQYLVNRPFFVQKTCSGVKSFFICFKVKFIFDAPKEKKLGNLKGIQIPSWLIKQDW